MSSSIPSWQILTAHAQPFRGARDLAFCLKVPLYSLLVWASSEGSGETARMRRLAWTFAARIGDKYQIRLTRSSWCFVNKLTTTCKWPVLKIWEVITHGLLTQISCNGSLSTYTICNGTEQNSIFTSRILISLYWQIHVFLVWITHVDCPIKTILLILRVQNP